MTAFVRARFGRQLLIMTLLAVLVASCCKVSSAADPYLWLEETDSPQVQKWIAAENAKTLGVLESDPRFAANFAKAKELMSAPDRLVLPALLGDGMVGNFWQDADHVRGIWRETTEADYVSPQPNWKTVLDLDELARTESRNWVWDGMSCDPVTHKRCLLQLSDGGEDAVSVREFDRATGRFVPNGFVLDRGKQSMSWVDIDTLLVSREWQPGEMTVSGYPYVVKRWKRGQPLDQAVEVARGERTDETPTRAVLVDNGAGRRINAVVRGRTFFENDFRLVIGDSSEPLALPPKSNFSGMVGNQVLVSIDENWTVDGTTYQSGSLLSLDVDEMTRDPGRLRPTVVYAPGPQEALQGVMTTRDHVIVTSLYDVKGRATVFSRRPDGSWSGAPVPLPDNAVVGGVDADSSGTTAYLTVSTMVTPTTLYRLDAADVRVEPVKSAPARFDSSRYVVEQMKATSTDGTEVPYFIVHAADMKYDGTTPTIMWAYGGFASSETPNYSGVVGNLWLAHGGAYVIANIRGGGEYGPRWHEAALKTKRQTAYDDLAAVARDMIARKITSPRYLGIEGGSNGGLLMGVEFTQHPELWNAVDIAIPLLDMVRYEQIAAGASWAGEYGSAANPDERAFLESISPYAQLKRGVKYPVPFIWTTTKDDRVGPQHARKFAARLAEYGSPYLFYELTQGGHGSGTNIDEEAKTTALEYTYFQRQLMPLPDNEKK
ncbi:MAG: prolyl oligopeptidase [Mycobacterium sp.]|jgi:prolyl oligopeptidase|nr:prolyl oligopeptidase [Mycobacterium sp.]